MANKQEAFDENADRYSTRQLRDNLSFLLRRAQIKQDVIDVDNHGHEVASIVSKRHGDVIKWLTDKYGAERLTQFAKLLDAHGGNKLGLKDLAKVLQAEQPADKQQVG